MLKSKKSRGIIREAVLLEGAALKQSEFTHQILTDFINDAINEGVCPDSLKTANITPAHKKKEPTDNENCRPMGVLPLLSKSLKNYFMINLVNT